MDLGIQGKVAVVLAAGGGLGGEIARTLASEGARLAIADIDAAALEQTRSSIHGAGGDVFAKPFDLADPTATDTFVDSVEKTFGGADILINNTGGPPPSLASGVSPNVWQTQFNAMVLSVFRITDLLLPYMRRKGWGRIITSTSSGVIAPIPNLGVSNALRSTLIGWSKTLAREVAPHAITANVVLPGRIATTRIQQLDATKAKREGKSIEDVARESARSIPLGRYGKPSEYADVVAFLASDRASYITGSIIRVDGGMLTNI